jgi:hypothetical protein
MTLFIDLGCLYCKQTQRAFNDFKNTLNWLKIDSGDQKLFKIQLTRVWELLTWRWNAWHWERHCVFTAGGERVKLKMCSCSKSYINNCQCRLRNLAIQGETKMRAKLLLKGDYLPVCESWWQPLDDDVVLVWLYVPAVLHAADLLPFLHQVALVAESKSKSHFFIKVHIM